MESVTVIERPGVPGAAHLAAELLENVDDLTCQLVDNILAGDFSYAEGTLLTLEQLTSAVRDNLFSLLSTLSGQGLASLDAARAAGRLKAQQGVPLAALLHAYRLAGRLIWAELVALAAEQDSAESLVHLASDVWAIIDDFSGAAADAYREFVADQTRQGATSRDVMLTALLDGTVDSSSRAREIMRMLNLADRSGYVVVCAEIGSGGAEPLPGSPIGCWPARSAQPGFSTPGRCWACSGYRRAGPSVRFIRCSQPQPRPVPAPGSVGSSRHRTPPPLAVGRPSWQSGVCRRATGEVISTAPRPSLC